MKKNVPLESSVVKSILTYLKTIPNCKAEKRHGDSWGNAGKPDITGCYAGIRFEFEVKRPLKSCKVSELQKKELYSWQNAGAVVAVIRDVNEVKIIINSIKEIMNDKSILLFLEKKPFKNLRWSERDDK